MKNLDLEVRQILISVGIGKTNKDSPRPLSVIAQIQIKLLKEKLSQFNVRGLDFFWRNNLESPWLVAAVVWNLAKDIFLVS